MCNHSDRSKLNPISSSNPKPEEIRDAREAVGLTPDEAGRIVHSTSLHWQEWESGDQRMHPAFWELFRIKTKQEGKEKQLDDDISLEQISEDEVQIRNRGEIVVVAIRADKNDWAAYDEQERKISGFSFPTPADVSNWWKSHGFFQNHQWRVTLYGLQSIKPAFLYELAIHQLIDLREHGDGFIYDLPSHMAEKEWVDLEAFIEAWQAAIAEHSSRLKEPFNSELLTESLRDARKIRAHLY